MNQHSILSDTMALGAKLSIVIGCPVTFSSGNPVFHCKHSMYSIASLVNLSDEGWQKLGKVHQEPSRAFRNRAREEVKK